MVFGIIEHRGYDLYMESFRFVTNGQDFTLAFATALQHANRDVTIQVWAVTG